jgi:hypothetical protein
MHKALLLHADRAGNVFDHYARADSCYINYAHLLCCCTMANNCTIRLLRGEKQQLHMLWN